MSKKMFFNMMKLIYAGFSEFRFGVKCILTKN